MPTTYEQAGFDVTDVAAGVMKKYHGELVDAGVTVAYLLASSDKGAAVKLNGYPCAAVVKVIGLKERADGRADAEVVIDALQWRDAHAGQREALLDHELYHLVLKGGAGADCDRDDQGRPKLKLRKHDHQFGWFDEIAHRHGDASYEVKQAKAFGDKHGQLYFGWQTPPDRPVESLRAATAELAKIVRDGGVTSVTLRAGNGKAVVVAGEKPKKRRRRAAATQGTGDGVQLTTAAAQGPVVPGLPVAFDGAPEPVRDYVTDLPREQRWFAATAWAICTSVVGDHGTLDGADKSHGDVDPLVRQQVYDQLETLADAAGVPWNPRHDDDDQLAAVRRCRVCGCTEADCRQCIAKTGEPCRWVEADLCSACVPVAADNEQLTTGDVEPPADEATATLRDLFAAAVDSGHSDLDWYDVLLVDVLVAGRADQVLVDQIRRAVVDATGTDTLGKLRDAVSDGDPLLAVFPGLTAVTAGDLVDAVRAYFNPDGEGADVAEPPTFDFATTFPPLWAGAFPPADPYDPAMYHADLIDRMAAMQDAYVAKVKERDAEGITIEQFRAAGRAVKKIEKERDKVKVDYSGRFGDAAWSSLSGHVRSITSKAAGQMPPKQPGPTGLVALIDRVDKVNRTVRLTVLPPADEQVPDVIDDADDEPVELEDRLDTAYAAAEAAIPSPANYGVTVDQIELSRGAVRPNGNVSANLQAQWNSSVGVPVRLAGHDGPYVSVMARMSTGSVTYVMHPLTAADPGRPAESWGKRRSSKQWTSSAPADVPLAGVACSSHDGLNYVFADWPTVEVVATREEYVEFEVRRQALADIAAHNRANKKAVPA